MPRVLVTNSKFVHLGELDGCKYVTYFAGIDIQQ
jgi:hypothetical protein